MKEVAQTPEAVALALMTYITGNMKEPYNLQKDQILDIYAECLQAAKGNRSWQR